MQLKPNNPILTSAENHDSNGYGVKLYYNRGRKGLSYRLECKTSLYQSRTFVADNTLAPLVYYQTTNVLDSYKPVLHSNLYDNPSVLTCNKTETYPILPAYYT